MFKKPFRVKSQTAMKGSDRKKLRQELQKTFQNLSADDVAEIIPSKGEVTTVKVYSHAGDNLFIYCVNKQPILFEIDKQKTIFPTVYLLWKYPDLVERFTTWPPVFKRLAEGADLMLPGVIVREQLTPRMFKHILKGQVCSVNIYSNKCPVAVGQALLSGSDFFDSGMKGKGVRPVHIMGDELWSYGDKSSPPSIEDDPIPQDLTDELAAETAKSNGANDVASNAESNKSKIDYFDYENEESKGGNNCDEKGIDNKGTESDACANADGSNELDGNEDANTVGEKDNYNTIEDEDNMSEKPLKEDRDQSNQKDSAMSMEGFSGKQDGEEKGREPGACGGGEVDGVDVENLSLADSGTSDKPMTQDEMDELLTFCFLCALKDSVKKSDLPLPTGTFYKQHVLRYCPQEKYLDIKKSSFKKLSKFLQQQQKTGIIKIKELSKGVDSLVEVDKSHIHLRDVVVPEIVVSEEPVAGQFAPPTITEMYAVTGNLVQLFKPMGYSKGSALKSGDVRKEITEYVRANNLQSEQCKSDVVLDPILAEILLTKAEGDKSTLKWDEIFSRLLNKMSPVFEIAFPNQPPVLKKGHIEPISVNVVQRASNKKATIVENLDLFGIDPKEFAHTVQVKVACSSTVGPSPQKNKGPQVIVQGNQVLCVGDLLHNHYRIPKKYTKGLDKAPKRR